MTPIEAMQSASLIAIAAIITAPSLARLFKFRSFSYPELIAFVAGYVGGTGVASALQLTGLAESTIRLVAAVIFITIVRFVIRRNNAEA